MGKRNVTSGGLTHLNTATVDHLALLDAWRTGDWEGYFLIYVLSILLSFRKRGRWAVVGEGGVVQRIDNGACRTTMTTTALNES